MIIDLILILIFLILGKSCNTAKFFAKVKIVYWLYGERNSCSKLSLFKFRVLSSGLVFFIFSSKSLQNIEKLQERALKFLYNDHTSSYDDLLSKSDRCTMLISRQRTLCIEIFKTVRKLNTPFTQKIFKLRTSCYSLRNPNDSAHIRPNQTTFQV